MSEPSAKRQKRSVEELAHELKANVSSKAEYDELQALLADHLEALEKAEAKANNRKLAEEFESKLRSSGLKMATQFKVTGFEWYDRTTQVAAYLDQLDEGMKLELEIADTPWVFQWDVCGEWRDSNCKPTVPCEYSAKGPDGTLIDSSTGGEEWLFDLGDPKGTRYLLQWTDRYLKEPEKFPELTKLVESLNMAPTEYIKELETVLDLWQKRSEPWHWSDLESESDRESGNSQDE